MTAQSHRMVGPKPGSVADLIVRAIHEHGPLSETELIATTGQVTAKRAGYRAAIRRSTDQSGYLYEVEGKFHLTAPMRQILESQYGREEQPKFEGEKTPGRYCKPFTPYQPPKHPRADEIRRVSFVSCGSPEFRVLG